VTPTHPTESESKNTKGDYEEELDVTRQTSINESPPGAVTPPPTGKGWCDDGVRTMDADAGRLTDEVLLAGLGTGDVDSAVAFVRRFQRVVFGVALAVAGDPGTAEDVARQAFEYASRHARAYDRQRGPVGAWLTRIARDLGVDTIHARAAAPATPDDLAGLLTAMSRQPDPPEAAHEGAAPLRATLARLPATQARAVAMGSVRGMTAQQIADAEGVPLGTARTRITDGMRKLRDAGSGSVATSPSAG
jgi:RNA polymerase sigma factor (sigma-70 family)